MSSKQNNFIPLFTKRLSAKMWIMGTMQPRIGNSLVICWEGEHSAGQHAIETVSGLWKAMTVGGMLPIGGDLAPVLEGTLPSFSYLLPRLPTHLTGNPSVSTHAVHMRQPTSQKDRKVEGQWTRSGLSLNSVTLRTVIVSFLEITSLCVKYLRKFH